MKRWALFALVMCLLLLSGCYNYSAGSQYGKIVGISFFDEEGEEIPGQFYDYFSFQEQFEDDTFLSLSNRLIPLNSPAPVELYYSAAAKAGSNVIARIKIEPHNGYEFSALTINHQKWSTADLVKVETNEGLIYADFLCVDLSKDNNLFTINSLEMKKVILDKTYYKTGSRFVEGRTYYSGFYLGITE
ncbi:MAG TPA: hypothetical protein PLO88_05355 [Bacilli bacterium]|nr:hypothetical protein [Bacilli bacterium]